MATIGKRALRVESESPPKMAKPAPGAAVDVPGFCSQPNFKRVHGPVEKLSKLYVKLIDSGALNDNLMDERSLLVNEYLGAPFVDNDTNLELHQVLHDGVPDPDYEPFDEDDDEEGFMSRVYMVHDAQSMLRGRAYTTADASALIKMDETIQEIDPHCNATPLLGEVCACCELVALARSRRPSSPNDLSRYPATSRRQVCDCFAMPKIVTVLLLGAKQAIDPACLASLDEAGVMVQRREK
tara:strand:+ start:235 stop:954 length:720 start_codon:yes stop_codon:yes gene_type:complete